jgi:hypothetical protein
MKINVILLCSLVIVGCDSGVLWRDPPYQVQWIDTSDNRTLSYDLGNGGSIGRVDAEVIAVGSNELYIVAKQRLTYQNTIKYYYIERSKDHKHQNGYEITQGPFNEKEFSELSAKLNLPSFTREF